MKSAQTIFVLLVACAASACASQPAGPPRVKVEMLAVSLLSPKVTRMPYDMEVAIALRSQERGPLVYCPFLLNPDDRDDQDSLKVWKKKRPWMLMDLVPGELVPAWLNCARNSPPRRMSLAIWRGTMTELRTVYDFRWHHPLFSWLRPFPLQVVEIKIPPARLANARVRLPRIKIKFLKTRSIDNNTTVTEDLEPPY